MFLCLVNNFWSGWYFSLLSIFINFHHIFISPFSHPTLHHFTITPLHHCTISWHLHIILFLTIQVKCINVFRSSKSLTIVCYLSLEKFEVPKCTVLNYLHGLWLIYHPSRVDKIHPVKLSWEGWRRIIRI